MEISSASGALILRNFLDFLIGNGHLPSHLPLPPVIKKRKKEKKCISGNETLLYFRKLLIFQEVTSWVQKIKKKRKRKRKKDILKIFLIFLGMELSSSSRKKTENYYIYVGNVWCWNTHTFCQIFNMKQCWIYAALITRIKFSQWQHSNCTSFWMSAASCNVFHKAIPIRSLS